VRHHKLDHNNNGVYDLTFLVKFMMPPCHPPKKARSLMSRSLVPPKQERLGISDKFFVLASDAIQMVVMEIVTWAVRSLSSGGYIYLYIYIYTYRLTRQRGGGFKDF